jgi:hypothetical protein
LVILVSLQEPNMSEPRGVEAVVVLELQPEPDVVLVVKVMKLLANEYLPFGPLLS